jgi:hypothetical protein
MSYAEWATAGAEVLIAGVIWWEMEVNRRDNFLKEAATIGNYNNRRKINSAFYATDGESVEIRSKRFCERLWSSEKDDDVLKDSCEEQIVLFNRLGQISRHRWFYRDDYVELFPHAVVLFWMLVEPYIEMRRALTGEWWARDFRELTRECLRFLLKDSNAKLYLYDRAGARRNDFVITTVELRQLKDRLTAPLKHP